MILHEQKHNNIDIDIDIVELSSHFIIADTSEAHESSKFLMTKAYGKYIDDLSTCAALIDVFKNIPIKSKSLVLDSRSTLQRLIELIRLNTTFKILPILLSTLDTLDAN